VNASEPFGCPGSGGGDLNDKMSERRYGGGSTRLYCQVALTYAVADADVVGLDDGLRVGDGVDVGLGFGVAVAVAVGVGDANPVVS